ncbi:MAG: hypothetical protein KDD60_12980, partial [Bdellovibrionales bacterium]|nr:hypothetical protein [Bdellovibrionales bacterium]
MKYITAEKDRSMLRRRIFGWKSGLWNLAGKISVRLGFLALISTRPMLTYKRHQALKGKTVLIYSMGKVGSSSIYYTLMRCFPFSRVHHNHFLSDEWIENRLPGTPFTRNIRLARAAHADISKAKGEFLYIVLMRDPVARDLSNIIQNYQNMSIDIF